MPQQLLRPRAEVKGALQEQMDRARSELLAVPINNEEDYRQVSQTMTRWQRYVVDLLGTLFSDPGPINEFNQALHHIYYPQPLREQVEDLRQDVQTLINRLRSILERVDLFDESPDARSRFAAISDVELLRQLEPLVGQIREELDAAPDVDPELKADVVGDLDSVEAQRHATTPNRGVIREALSRVKDNWPSIAVASSVVANIVTIIHGL